MHGLLLKRQGVHVTILEQDPSSERVANEAGIGFAESVSEFLRKFDVTGLPLAIECQATKFAWRKNQHPWTVRGMRNLSNWSLLYRVLRANFDGLPSSACPKPPAPVPGDGHAEYRAGCRVTDMALMDDGARISFADSASQKHDSIVADMVIGADGIRSTVRRLIGASTQERYSGYITWRGTVPESQVSHDTASYFQDTVGLNFTHRSYSIV
jgi:2-polyprenyl-6-methoxyphenol hydroxylase-like FAD-dependent oxidoreductase